MSKERLTAFSDGVIAVIITIMVLELKVPHHADLSALAELFPVFLSYILSFVYVGIYWNNHHHFFHTVKAVNGPILWGNMFLLFWLSLTPFATAWMSENHFATLPVAHYGLTLLMCGGAYKILQLLVIHHQGQDGALARAIGKDQKGNLSLGLYLVGIGMAFVTPIAALAIYALVALIWLIPDPRIERAIGDLEM